MPKTTGKKASVGTKSQYKRINLRLPFSYFWLKDIINQIISYKYFADALLMIFAFVSLGLAFKFYPLVVFVLLLMLIFGLSLVHPLLGLMALLFFSYPPLIYQAPLIAWTFSIFVIAALFAGFFHYRTVSFLFSLLMLPLSPIGWLLELPVFTMAVMVLGFKRASLSTFFALLMLTMFAGLTNRPIAAPIAYNSTAANNYLDLGALSQYFIPNKPQPSLANFTASLGSTILSFFSIKVSSLMLNAYAYAGKAVMFKFPFLLVQILVWILLTFVIANYVVKSREEFKGTQASFFAVIIPITYILLSYLLGMQPRILLAALGFIITPGIIFVLEAQNIEVVQALNVLKQDFLWKFGEENMITPKETFDDVADYENIKKELDESIIEPIEHREITGAYGIQPTKGILLFGPPGTGKTLIMRALANEIRAGFYYVSGPSLITAFPGESSAALVKIFETAKKHAPAVLFIDEIDAIARKRTDAISEPVRELLATLLTEMDGFLKTPGVVIVGATNIPNALDPALLRPGRFDKAIYVRLPDQKGREAILKYYFSKLPVDENIDYKALAEQTIRFSGADIRHLAEETARQVSEKAIASKTVLKITMQDILNVLKTMKPSTSLAMLEEYNTFELDFERMMHPEKAEEEAKPKVSLEDVVDLEEAKKALYEAIEIPIMHPDMVKKYDVQGIKGILLFGPPGTGKTMLMNAIANELGDVHFIALSGPDISKGGIDEGIETIKEMFNRAKENQPSVIFIDEVDAIVPERDAATEEGRRLVGELLEEFDKLKEEGDNVVIVAATNRPDSIDPALLRPGRFDRLIYIPPPNQNDRIELFKEYLGKAPLANDIDFDKLAELTPGFTGADIANVCRQAKVNALEESVAKEEEVPITMKMLEDIITTVKPSASSQVLGRYMLFLSRYGKR